MSSFVGVCCVFQFHHTCGLSLRLKSHHPQSPRELNDADFPLAASSLLYICAVLCHQAVITIACRPDTALAQMVEMSALCWIWWKDDCWRVVVDHTYVPSGLPCCGTSGYSWGIAQHDAVHALASVDTTQHSPLQPPSVNCDGLILERRVCVWL